MCFFQIFDRVKRENDRLRLEQVYSKKVLQDVEATLEAIRDDMAFHNVICHVCENVVQESIVLWPCRHAGLCEKCTLKVDVCPFCNVEIDARFKIYYP